MPIVIALLAAVGAGYGVWAVKKKRDATQAALTAEAVLAEKRAALKTAQAALAPQVAALKADPVKAAQQLARLGVDPAKMARTAGEVPEAGLRMGAALGQRAAIEELRARGYDVSMYTPTRA